MKQMWSPWRAAHMNESSDNSEPGERDVIDRSSTTTKTITQTIFSRLAGEDKDEENLILWRGTHVFVIMNLYPYNNGHLLIVPYRIVEQYEDLKLDEMMELTQTIDLCIRCIKMTVKPDGINVGMNLGKAAGAGIPDHLHVHVVPRWLGDTNFMPAIAETKVIPEALNDTYKKLQYAFNRTTLRAS